MIVELNGQFWAFITSFLLINAFSFLGFYYTTKTKLKVYDDTIKDLRKEIATLNTKIDTLILKLLKN